MKVWFRALTMLLAVLLTANLPVAAMSCEPEQGGCAVGSESSDCCVPTGCHCDMTSRGAPSSRDDAGTTATPTVTPTAKAVVAAIVMFACCDADTAPTVATGTVSGPDSRPPAYKLTHAFLI